MPICFVGTGADGGDPGPQWLVDWRKGRNEGFIPVQLRPRDVIYVTSLACGLARDKLSERCRFPLPSERDCRTDGGVSTCTPGVFCRRSRQGEGESRRGGSRITVYFSSLIGQYISKGTCDR